MTGTDHTLSSRWLRSCCWRLAGCWWSQPSVDGRPRRAESPTSLGRRCSDTTASVVVLCLEHVRPMSRMWMFGGNSRSRRPSSSTRSEERWRRSATSSRPFAPRTKRTLRRTGAWRSSRRSRSASMRSAARRALHADHAPARRRPGAPPVRSASGHGRSSSRTGWAGADDPSDSPRSGRCPPRRRRAPTSTRSRQSRRRRPVPATVQARRAPPAVARRPRRDDAGRSPPGDARVGGALVEFRGDPLAVRPESPACGR